MVYKIFRAPLTGVGITDELTALIKCQLSVGASKHRAPTCETAPLEAAVSTALSPQITTRRLGDTYALITDAFSASAISAALFIQ